MRTTLGWRFCWPFSPLAGPSARAGGESRARQASAAIAAGVAVRRRTTPCSGFCVTRILLRNARDRTHPVRPYEVVAGTSLLLVAALTASDGGGETLDGPGGRRFDDPHPVERSAGPASR